MVEVNLLPFEIRIARRRAAISIFAILVAAALTSVVAVKLYLTNVSLARLYAELELTKSELGKYESVIATQELLDDTKAALENHREFIQKYVGHRDWFAVLNHITNVINSVGTVVELSVSSTGEVKVVGQARSLADVAYIMENIHYFNRIDVSFPEEFKDPSTVKHPIGFQLLLSSLIKSN